MHRDAPPGDAVAESAVDRVHASGAGGSIAGSPHREPGGSRGRRAGCDTPPTAGAHPCGRSTACPCTRCWCTRRWCWCRWSRRTGPVLVWPTSRRVLGPILAALAIGAAITAILATQAGDPDQPGPGHAHRDRGRLRHGLARQRGVRRGHLRRAGRVHLHLLDPPHHDRPRPRRVAPPRRRPTGPASVRESARIRLPARTPTGGVGDRGVGVSARVSGPGGCGERRGRRCGGDRPGGRGDGSRGRPGRPRRRP